MTKGKGKNPGAGGLNKHINRQAHKERQQPGWRKHLGAFEKHKDYSRRAKRRQEKVKKLRELKRAAAQRNPDEFHIKMTKNIVDPETGRMRKRRATVADRQKDLEKTVVENSSNINYLGQQVLKDRRRAAELLEEVAGLDTAKSNCSHTIFVEDADAYDRFDPVKHFNTTKDLLKYPAMRANIDRLGGIVHNSTLQQNQLTLQTAANLKKNQAVAAKADVGMIDDEADDEADNDNAIDPSIERTIIIAKRMKEITQRSARANTLERLASSLRNETRGIKNKLSVKETNKYRHNVNVRSR
eukprot:GILI01013657.1.p1 GENE.GILI01013657.1~~GILI01013657.1.p1  ORF type:complete len:299 (-),score=49.14 GILI01013657.1:77-973(-)